MVIVMFLVLSCCHKSMCHCGYRYEVSDASTDHLFTITTTVAVCSITMIIYRKEIPFFDDRAKWEGSGGGLCMYLVR